MNELNFPNQNLKARDKVSGDEDSYQGEMFVQNACWKRCEASQRQLKLMSQMTLLILHDVNIPVH